MTTEFAAKQTVKVAPNRYESRAWTGTFLRAFHEATTGKDVAVVAVASTGGVGVRHVPLARVTAAR